MATGFLQGGRVTFARFQVSGNRPGMFETGHLDALAENGIGKQRIAAADRSEVGWIGGDHILDTEFSLEKNIVNECLQFALRVDTNRPPGNLLRAHAKAELDALAKDNPSGFPSAKQKREARATARERVEQEAKDGRFLKRKGIPVLWDGHTGEVLIGSSSGKDIDRVCALFEQTFDRKLLLQRAGERAFALAEAAGTTAAINDAGPSGFVPGSPEEFAWIPDSSSRDFLGNEFLLWLWWYLDTQSDAVGLMDGSEATVMLARQLVLECPRGQMGRDGFRSDGPTRLPEASRALQAGRLPRKSGLTVVRHDKQYEFAWNAESFVMGGVKLPPPEAEDARARLEERVTNLRDFLEMTDLLYDAFLRVRLTRHWPEVLGKVKGWLSDGAGVRKSA